MKEEYSVRVLAIRHVEIEDLGMMEDIFREKNWSFDYLDTPKGENSKGLSKSILSWCFLEGIWEPTRKRNTLS